MMMGGLLYRQWKIAMIARMSKSEGIDRFSDLLVRFKARSVSSTRLLGNPVISYASEFFKKNTQNQEAD